MLNASVRPFSVLSIVLYYTNCELVFSQEEKTKGQTTALQLKLSTLSFVRRQKAVAPLFSCPLGRRTGENTNLARGPFSFSSSFIIFFSNLRPTILLLESLPTSVTNLSTDSSVAGPHHFDSCFMFQLLLLHFLPFFCAVGTSPIGARWSSVCLLFT